MDHSWYEALEDEFKKAYFSKACIFLLFLTPRLIYMLAERIFIYRARIFHDLPTLFV